MLPRVIRRRLVNLARSHCGGCTKRAVQGTGSIGQKGRELVSILAGPSLARVGRMGSQPNPFLPRLALRLPQPALDLVALQGAGQSGAAGGCLPTASEWGSPQRRFPEPAQAEEPPVQHASESSDNQEPATIPNSPAAPQEPEHAHALHTAEAPPNETSLHPPYNNQHP
jgi:hypothetical protein